MNIHKLINRMNKSEPFKHITFIININKFISSELFLTAVWRCLVRPVNESVREPVLIIKVFISINELVVGTCYVNL